MKNKLIIFMLLGLFIFSSCKNNDENNDPKPDINPGQITEPIDDPFVNPPSEPEIETVEGTYYLYVEDEFDILSLTVGKNPNVEVSDSNNCMEINGFLIKAVKEGSAVVTVEDGNIRLIINMVFLPKREIIASDIELFVGETKELKVEYPGFKYEDIIFTSPMGMQAITLTKENGKFYVKGNEVGTYKAILVTKGAVKEINVIVKKVVINVLNDNFTVDCLDTLKIELDYPKDLINKEDINYYLYKEGIIEIKDDTIIPIKEGKVKVRVQMKDDRDTSTVFEVNVTIDPIKIIKILHQEEALMLKEIRLYADDYVTQSFMGSVSRYSFSDLNLVEQIIDIYDNPYIGQVATPEIVNYLDKKVNKSVPGAPRSGVKMTGINYITYHDTGNNAAGANAQANANWMKNPSSVDSTARSWHYTVDENQVIHSIPDDEITWQGDNYTAYTESIGIETCVNEGANMDKVWHRMGKLCAKLMYTYNIDINHIKQHYDWMGKDCPQTLRRNGLYQYALGFVEGELLVKKYLNGYKITFESLNPEYLDNNGQIIKAPLEEIEVGYKVTITNSNGYNESVTLYTKVSPLK